ncbi:putative disease resistance protein [Citrus sinensis]|uniref:Disease resistance protein n=1 Tax=Citrus sinensis TaxID=2711 RepID=A0ACB8MA83_CITSI|nr:putative disease resistance protein [Citrus sinensis]
MAVEELLLSAFFQVLFDRLASGDFLTFVGQLRGGLDSELKKWEKTLIMIQAVLSDAEEKQLTDRAVKIWLDDLRDLAYDAEDILDEFATEALKQKTMAENSNHSPACFNCFSPSSVKFKIDMDSKIKSITSRLDELCAKRIVLGLQLIPGGMSNAWKRRPPSSSVPTERAVYGRDEDKARILEMVLSDDPTADANFCVIPIVGMAGSGKTTLAREVYNDRAVQNFKFDVKAWVCVSDDFDVVSISRALLESITSTTCDLKTLNEVQVKLKIAVDGKRFLLVLDDVWNENYNLWEILKAPFMAGAPNSKIIVTTRHSNVASTMGSVEHYNLKLLSDEDCWSVFVKHAFESRDAGAHQFSELFRKKIVAKCGGLPLAASTLGGLLRTRHTEDAWEDILSSKMWDLPQQTDILPVLRLSYHYLPSHLKRCFSYCAIFPKDYEFEKNELVFLWMAEGMIQQSRTDKQLEDLGNDFFWDLLSRSLFQQSSRDGCKFVMHDLVHDLAQLVSGETCFWLEEASKQLRTFKRIRHFSYPCAYEEVKAKFEGLDKAAGLRTFLPLKVRSSYCFITNTVLLDLLPKLKKLRVLSLEGYYIAHLPNSIKDLKLLRYLNLSCTLIESLPESINSLFNLQFLVLRGCDRLQKLPSNLRNLINLHLLDIRGAHLLTAMPSGMKRLKYLHTLSDFIVGKGIVSGLKDLKSLTFLCGKLCIWRLENANNSWEAREASLCDKKCLEALSLKWGSPYQSRNVNDQGAEENVLDMLQPHKNIKKLEIMQYGGRRFPTWLGDPSFSNMVALKLIGCKNCTSLPAVGQLVSLKELTIERMLVLRSIGSEFCGKNCSKPFQSLETLCFSGLPEWEFWDTGNQTGYIEIFPCLVELSILGCPKLSGKLPDHLPALETLVVRYCEELLVSFSSFPLLCKLEIYRCKGLVCSSPIDFKLTKSITISSCSLDIYGCKGMVYNSPLHSKSLSTPVTTSNILEFGKLLKQGFLPTDFLGIADSQDIGIWRPHLQSMHFGEEAVQGLRIITLPEEVSLEENCMNLVSFPEVKFFPINQLKLKFENSGALKSLPEGMIYNCAQRKSLTIEGCDSLEFIARGKLPSSLEGIQIRDCKKLQCLVVDEEDASAASSSLSSSSMALKWLDISGCSELANLSSRSKQLPEELEFLNIEDCPKLESIAESFHGNGRLKRIVISDCGNLKSIPKGQQNLNCLKEVKIFNCLSLVSFPEGGLPSTVTGVSIGSCEKLKALPEDLHKLHYLQELEITECPSIESFPEAGFPTNLTLLAIADIKMYKAIIRWGLHRLTSLLRLYIQGGDNAESFPDERMGIILPTSLNRLSISGFPSLKCLSAMGFQSLVSLEFLRISNCPKLKSFPEVGLPHSLLQLHIRDCSLLKKQCKRDKGKDWSKIAHIPYVTIDGKFIFD